MIESLLRADPKTVEASPLTPASAPPRKFSLPFQATPSSPPRPQIRGQGTRKRPFHWAPPRKAPVSPNAPRNRYADGNQPGIFPSPRQTKRHHPIRRKTTSLSRCRRRTLMPWHASLQLDYTLEGTRTVARHAHNGPLRILQSLYPEGDAVCHNVLVHPPGGLVGGDTLDITATVGPGRAWPRHHTGRHALLPVYRRTGPAAHAPHPGRGRAAGVVATGGALLQRLQRREPPHAEPRPRRRVHGLGRDRAGPAACRAAL
jgi:hypothetical protein